MKKQDFLKIFLGVLFLAAIGTKGVYAQNYTSNYFTSGQPSLALPASFDENTLTEEEKVMLKLLMDELEESPDDYCEEDAHFWYQTYFFEATESEFMEWAKETYDTVCKKDGFIVWRNNNIDYEYAINLDSLIYEERWFEEENGDNPFFGEPGNNLWGVDRIIFKRVNGYIVPDKEIDISYEYAEDIIEGIDLGFLSEIVCEITMTYTYPYYELIDDDNGNTLVKDGDEDLYKDCMGYTGVKEVQREASIRIYPNPTAGQLRIENYELREIESVEIYDVVGRKLQSTIVNLQSTIEIDISHLQAGLYFLKIDGRMFKVIKE